VLREEIKQIAANCQTAGESYSHTLNALLEYLKIGQFESMETQRTLRLLDLMKVEIELVVETETKE
jgi:hypothetical protein